MQINLLPRKGYLNASLIYFPAKRLEQWSREVGRANEIDIKLFRALLYYTPLLFTLVILLGGSLFAPNSCELPKARSAKLHTCLLQPETQVLIYVTLLSELQEAHNC